MSDFVQNNWEFARFIEKYGQQNSLKNINIKGQVLPADVTQLDFNNKSGTITREPTNYTKSKKRKYNGIQLDTTRPNSSVPSIPTTPTLVVFSNNQNIFKNDQQICGQDYYL